MTQKLQTLSEVITAYQERGRRLWTGEPLNPADIEMLNQLRASPLAAEAFAEIMKGAAQTHAERLEEAAKRKEEAKAFAKTAEGAAAKAFARMMEHSAKALARMKEEAAQACVRTLKHAAAEEGAAMQAFAKRREEAAAKALDNIAPPEMKAPFLIDDCVEAREIYAFKHRAQVERLRNTPSAEEVWTKLAQVAVHIGASDAHDIEAIRMMGVALGYRRRHHEYERLSTSRRGDKPAARSEATAWIKSSVLRLSGKSVLRLSGKSLVGASTAKSDVDHIIAMCDVVFKTTKKTAISERSVRRATLKEELLDRRFPRKESRRLKKVLSPGRLG